MIDEIIYHCLDVWEEGWTLQFQGGGWWLERVDPSDQDEYQLQSVTKKQVVEIARSCFSVEVKMSFERKVKAS